VAEITLLGAARIIMHACWTRRPLRTPRRARQSVGHVPEHV